MKYLLLRIRAAIDPSWINKTRLNRYEKAHGKLPAPKPKVLAHYDVIAVQGVVCVQWGRAGSGYVDAVFQETLGQ